MNINSAQNTALNYAATRAAQFNQNSTPARLESGAKINRAGDDAAGLAISEKMRAQTRGINQAAANASDGTSLIQTAEGALNSAHNVLQRTRELTAQAGGGTTSAPGSKQMMSELNALSDQVRNNNPQLAATPSDAGSPQSAPAAQNTAAATSTPAAPTSIEGRRQWMEDRVAGMEATMPEGATSVSDASRRENMVTYSQSNILQQAGQSMLAQANQSTANVLSMLGGSQPR